MTLSNTALRYGSVTKTFHWLTALLILTLIPLGFYANYLPYETQEQLSTKAWFFSLHKTLGVTVFFVALARIIWALTQPKPGLLNADKKVESWLAKTVHWLLYASLVIVPLAGWISHAAASGFAPIWWPFGQDLPLIPKNTSVEHVFVALHLIAGKVLIGALILHAVGALKHHFVDGDSTLRRMLPGEPSIGPIPAQNHTRTPVVTACVVWAGAIALGLGLGLAGGESDADAGEAAALQQVASDWQVQDGSIGLTVSQFGSEVTGSFADWTSSITFDPNAQSGTVGSVTTTISIPSLQLGSVTQQAKGADFFAAEDHPTATFEADITVEEDQYTADGTLTIKDQTVPVSLPFDIEIDQQTARMSATTTLDRREFNIGEGVTDADTLAFDVSIDIQVTVTRQSD